MKFIADMHTHTCASTHAFCTITENAAEAARKGITILGMTDHGVKMPDSPHEWHFLSMVNLPRKINGVYIVRGMETNIINENGEVDIPDEEVYGVLEWTVASFHPQVCPPLPKAECTKAYIKALENPRVDCIGHSESRHYDYDFREVCKAARAFDKAIELNCARLRGADGQKRYRLILDACAEEGTKIIVNSDAHYFDRIGDFAQAEKFLEGMKFPHELIMNISEQNMKRHIITHTGNIFE